MQVRIIGGEPGVTDDNGKPLDLGQGQALLQTIAVLTVAGGPLPSAALQDMLWDPAEVDDPGRALRARLSKLRKPLGKRLTSSSRGYGLHLEQGDYVDLRVFRSLVTAAEQANRIEDYEVAADLYQSALHIWQGETLLGLLPDTAVMAPTRNSLQMEWQQTYEASVEIRLGLGHHQQLARELPERLERDPLHEDLARLLMIAHHRSGRKDRAVQVYATFCAHLRAEINAEPGTLLQRTHTQIIGNDPVLDWVPLPVSDSDKAVLATGADPRTPSHARTFNMQLGGKHNLPADRALVKKAEAVAPNISDSARANEAFFVRAIRYVAKEGIDQYIEFGTGLPTDDSPHRVARRVAMGARTLYVTADATVIDYINGALTDRHTGIFHNEMRDPAEILEHPETRRLIDLAQPTAIIFRDILNYVPEHYEPARFINGIMSAFPAGSYLILANGTSVEMPDALAEHINAMFADVPRPLILRTQEQIEAMFGCLTLLPPGVGRVDTWGIDAPPLDLAMLVLGGVAIKQ